MFVATFLTSLMLASHAISPVEASKLDRVVQDAQERRGSSTFGIPFNSGTLPNMEVIRTGDTIPVFAKSISGMFRLPGRNSFGGTPTGEAEGLLRRKSSAVGLVVPACSCTTPSDAKLDFKDVRPMSDEFCANGNEPTDVGASNMVWAWGQFLDHDLVATLDNHEGKTFPIQMTHGRQTATMKLTRLLKKGRGKCKTPINTATPQIDAGTVYSPDEEYLHSTLREPGSCKLRMMTGNFLPLSGPETTSPNARPKRFFLAGDLRVNEHAVLTSMHTLWVREHNRICNMMERGHSGKARRGRPSFGRPSRTDQFRHMTANQRFKMARKVVVAKMQKITLKEFLPAIGITKHEMRHIKPKLKTSDISLEFATAAYRFGHDLVPASYGDFNTSDLFDGEKFFLEQHFTGTRLKQNANQLLDKLMQTIATTKANKVDGKVSDALRNVLFGAFGEDLISRNIFRGRDVGLPSYQALNKCYGTYYNLDKSDKKVNGDAFLGLTKEKRPTNKMLGKTARLIIAEQIKRVLFSQDGYHWKEDAKELQPFLREIHTTKFSHVIKLNTGAKVPHNVFKA